MYISDNLKDCELRLTCITKKLVMARFKPLCVDIEVLTQIRFSLLVARHEASSNDPNEGSGMQTGFLCIESVCQSCWGSHRSSSVGKMLIYVHTCGSIPVDGRVEVVKLHRSRAREQQIYNHSQSAPLCL